MAVVQNASQYTEEHVDAFAGMIGTGSPCILDTYEVATGEVVHFGRAVKRHGTTADECEEGVDGDGSTPFAATNFLGIAVAEATRVGTSVDANVNRFETGANLSVLSQGDIWIQLPGTETVAVGDDVTVDPTTGALSSSTATATQHAIPGRWMTAQATGGGLAMVRLFGTIN